MRDGALPAALLCAALAIALSYGPRRLLLPGLIALVAVALVVALIGVDAPFEEAAFLGCWVSIVALGCLIHLPQGPGPRGMMTISINAGVWVGAVTSVAGDLDDLLKVLPVALIALPASWLATTNARVALKVIASWLAAVAILAAAVPLVETPGYEPDHRE